MQRGTQYAPPDVTGIGGGRALSAALIVDGPNFFHLKQGLEGWLDYGALSQALEEYLWMTQSLPLQVEQCILVSPAIDWTFPNSERLWFFHRALRNIGFSIAYAVRTSDDDLIVDIADITASCYDVVILASGDGDFVPCVQRLKDDGCFTVVLSSNYSHAYMCSHELQDAASCFIEVTDLCCGVAPRRDSETRFAPAHAPDSAQQYAA